ncbi:MAG: hypothetical protein PF440_11365 [Thiomicrorhabdus sp.]|jgi:DNA helicase HerA-like ATPase|nr:hypothetical protein [Thiomicrorhabdus sp.]
MKFFNRTLLAPTTRAKNVVIATDIVGDATVWYLVNQINTTSIIEDELTQVAVLTGVNNVELVNFTPENFF